MTFLGRVERKVTYLFVLTALVAAAAVGYSLLREAAVSAQKSENKKAQDVDELKVPTLAIPDTVESGMSGSELASRLKICSIAGPGIPINTLLRFTVTGTGALDAAPPDQAAYGTVTKTVDVRAGDPATEGSCEFVPGFGADAPGYDQFQTFLNGTPVTVVENGISPSNAVPQNSGQLRTSRIRELDSAFASTAVAGFTPNPDFAASAGYVSRAAVIASGTLTQVEFANFRFNPTVLKVCKIAGTPSLVGVAFTFTIALASPVSQPGNVPLFPSFSVPVTVIAGPPGPQSANCTFVNDSGLLGGALNQGSTITVTEAAGSGTTLTALTCPSCGAGGLTADLITRKATLSGPNGLLPSVNAVVFTNVDYVCRDVEASRKGNSDKGPKSELSRPDCIQRSVRYDFDGDGKADPAIFTPSEARLTVATSADDYMHHSLNIFGLATDKLVPADYDGDGKNDIAVWRPSNGNWYVAGTAGIYQVHQWGEPGDIPQVGDYDGDGKSDFVVWRPSTGTWYMKNSQEGFRIFQFGIATDKPKAADYDGDGKTDAGVFRRGTWYTLQSTQGFRVTNFGQSRDIPVPGDYDGDRAADLAVYRNGTWYIHTGTVYSVRQWGSATDLPVPADYDGDGKTDLAIFRPSEGNWYIRRSAVSEDGPLTVALGSSTDIPLQLPQ